MRYRGTPEAVSFGSCTDAPGRCSIFSNPPFLLGELFVTMLSTGYRRLLGGFFLLLPVTVAGVMFQVHADQPPKIYSQSAERMSVEAPIDAAFEKSALPQLADSFRVPTGFQVERLFTVPQDELGSWVSLAIDSKGRLITSDQGEKGLMRITPAPFDGSRPTLVEKIPLAITGAQGILWAFDSLYVVCNGGPGSGLYRLRDTNGDDTLDSIEKLIAIPGGGEHGPHNIVLSPDGKKLFVIAGNHTKFPFDVKDLTPTQTMGGARQNQRRVSLSEGASSRLPANWDEDLLTPRMWDANGHATGILAPGGWVASTDPDGKTWDVWSTGYRNPYDFAFNADGEMFVYDADMEWDVGAPWYRPTRVNHATSGSELGWRSGSGKWPKSFPDSTPPLVEIGPGSPVGVTFGYGAKFPAKYQKALFVLDWTFGTIWAIHTTPDGSSYSGIKEDFLSRTPLPLTDAIVAPDGALYFTVGGRGTQSELYRVTYSGTESTARVDAKEPRGAQERLLRQSLEANHMPAADPRKAVEQLLKHLGHQDRFIRYAARVALEHQPLELWVDQSLLLKDPLALINASVAVARQAEPKVLPNVLDALKRIDYESLDTAGRRELARAYELSFIRLGMPDDVRRMAIIDHYFSKFPTGDDGVDRELAAILVHLKAPGIVTTLCGMLSASVKGVASTNLGDDEALMTAYAARNSNFGGAIKEYLLHRGDLQQIHYAYVLRSAKEGWTSADRKAYFAWFERASAWAGGNSFRKFLSNIQKESLDGLPEKERADAIAMMDKKTITPVALPKPEGPGRIWTVEEIVSKTADVTSRGARNFERGKRAFAAARCAVCHRFGDDGGATGPDLTQAAGRFSVKDMAEALLHPSKVVSDQYKASIVTTSDGKAFTGRIVSDSGTKIIVVTDPEDASKFVEIERSNIEEIIASTESLMPKGLLDALNESEVLDLMAYTLSRNNPSAQAFQKP